MEEEKNGRYAMKPAYRTRWGSSPQGKPQVWYTGRPDAGWPGGRRPIGRRFVKKLQILWEMPAK